MIFNIHCPHCQNLLEVESAWAGHQLDCPLCNKAFSVPHAPLAQAAVATPPVSAAPPIGLWNPNAAASWSVLFGPAFGPYLHHLNWRALGDHNRAAGAFRWFVAGLLLTFGLTFGVLFSPQLSSAAFMISLFFMVVWLFASGKKQVALIKEQFGENYERRSWWQPLLAGTAAILLLGVLVEVAGGRIGQEIVTRQSVSIINDILTRSNINPDVRCLRVQLNESAGPNDYLASAFFSTGESAPARIQVQRDVILVNLEPSVILALQANQAMNSLLTRGTTAPKTEVDAQAPLQVIQPAPEGPRDLEHLPALEPSLTIGDWTVKAETVIGLEQLRKLQEGNVAIADGIKFLQMVGRPNSKQSAVAGYEVWNWPLKDGKITITVDRAMWEKDATMGVVEFESSRKGAQ